MVIDKPFETVDTNEAPPPAYDSLLGPALPAPPCEKAPLDAPPLPPLASTSKLSPAQPPKSPLPSPSRTLSSHSQNQTRLTVLSLLRTLITSHLTDNNPLTAQGILDSCITACSTFSLSLPALLQTRYIEDHSPVYWALLKRPSNPGLVEMVIELSRPWSQQGEEELRSGVLVNSDHLFFRRYLVEEEEVRLLVDEERDVVDVEGSVQGDDAAFGVSMCLPAFQRRMMVRGEVCVEFVAKGRLFRLRFYKSDPTSPSNYAPSTASHAGAWLVSLHILGASPSTFIDSRLLIPDPAGSPPDLVAPSSPSNSYGYGIFDKKPSPHLKPTISIRLSTPSSTPLISLPPFSSLTRAREKRAYPQMVKDRGVCVSLEQSSLMGASLTYEGSAYLGADGRLRASLEARLGKRDEMECVIC